MVKELFFVEGTDFSILLTLSKEYPLSIIALYKRITVNFGTRVSYQAVHKKVNKLLERGIIVQEDKFFKLNIFWVKNWKKFFQLTYNDYLRKKGLQKFPV